MKDNKRINNKVYLRGKVEKELEYSHEVLGEVFYRTEVSTERYSGVKDVIPVIISSRLIYNKPLENLKGKHVELYGQFRSYNKLNEEKGTTSLELFLFVKKIELCENDNITYENIISLEGYICKPPAYRVTLLGKEITDIMIAVPGEYNKSSYIPCIAWRRKARLCKYLDVGDKTWLEGRIQSREYIKHDETDNQTKTKVAYEVSIKDMFQTFE